MNAVNEKQRIHHMKRWLKEYREELALIEAEPRHEGKNVQKLLDDRKRFLRERIKVYEERLGI